MKVTQAGSVRRRDVDDEDVGPRAAIPLTKSSIESGSLTLFLPRLIPSTLPGFSDRGIPTASAGAAPDPSFEARYASIGSNSGETVGEDGA